MTKLYEVSKEKELKVIQHYESRLGKNANVIEVDDYSPADMVVAYENGFWCLEVKSRQGRYDLEFFKKYGMSCETYKLKELSRIYGVKRMTLVTITSDGYVIKGVADFSTPTQTVMTAKTTAFANKTKVQKEFYVVKDFIIEKDIKF